VCFLNNTDIHQIERTYYSELCPCGECSSPSRDDTMVRLISFLTPLLGADSGSHIGIYSARNFFRLLRCRTSRCPVWMARTPSCFAALYQASTAPNSCDATPWHQTCPKSISPNSWCRHLTIAWYRPYPFGNILWTTEVWAADRSA
jgi:hypothetical protein